MNKTGMIDPNALQANLVTDDFRTDFKELFEISPETKEKMKGKSLSLIFYECALGSLELTFKDRQLTLKFKRFSEKNMEVSIKKKIASYDQVVKNIVIPTLQACFALAGIYGGTMQALGQAFKAAADGASSQYDSKHQAELQGLDHCYKTEDQLTEQGRRNLQEAAQIIDRLLDIWTKEADRLQQSFNSISNN